jgi:ATP-dependent helicase/nuclease subunit A
MNLLTPHQKEALNYKEHISLTANAGSGKTFVLSKRYVEIALNENVSLRNLVAITFTEKAASELYKKISEEIELRLADSDSPKEHNKLELLRAQLVSANISTIHSFCISILKEFPAEALLDANFTPIDKTLSDELIQLSIEEVLKAGFKNPAKSRELKYLIRIFASKNLFAEELIQLIDKRKNLISIKEKLYSKSEEEIARNLFTLFEEYVTPLVEENLSEVLNNIREINNEVLLQNPRNELAIGINELFTDSKKVNSLEETSLLLMQVREQLFTKDGSVRSQGYLRKNRESYSGQIEFIENYFAETEELSFSSDHKEIELELAKFGKMFIKYFSETLSVYEEKKKQNGYLDFEDILLHTKNILLNEEVRQSLGEKYKFIMVDEYQDTNEIQYEIFMPILEYLKKGNLFVVGDEKQSIYMFRDAELEIFNKTKYEISAVTNEKNLLVLPHSFRMAPNICLFTNHVFSKLFKNPIPMFNEVEYNELVCARDESTGGNIEFILAEKDSTELTEAVLVAKRIIKLYNEYSSVDKLSFNDIAVLCRRRKSFNELEKAFSEYGIPYNIVGGRGFYQQQIIYDVYNYLAFLLNNDDDAALVGVLRSPFFSVSDTEIFDISLKQGDTFWQKLMDYSLSSEKIWKIKLILIENSTLAYSTDVPKLLRKLFAERAFLAVASSSIDNSQEIPNLEKLISVAQNFALQGFRTLFDFVNFLSDAMENVIDEGEAVPYSTEDTVKIMTLHQAKGLEFKAVVLFNCNDKGRTDFAKSKTVRVDKNFGILTNVPVNNNYFEKYKQAPVVSLHNYIQKRKNSAELKRLLYVGITRAKDFLIISALQKDLNFHKDSFMGLISSVLKIDKTADNIVLNGDIILQKSAEMDFVEDKKSISLNIPVIKNFEESESIKIKETAGREIKKVFRAEEISDSEKEEIISATKVAVYKQCPLKYQLTYEFGYSDLFENYRRSITDFDFRQNENEYNFYSDVKGRVIHKILEKQYSLPAINEKINSLIEIELGPVNTKSVIDNIRNSILVTLENYYNSETFKNLSAYQQYQNEVELYCKVDDYFLYGIIDKLILDNDAAIIIDYKTDNIIEDEIEERFQQYLIQLKFYAFLIGKLYRNIKNFNLAIIFLKFADKKMSKDISVTDLSDIGSEIRKIISEIRKKNFPKNLDHCRKCSYSLENGICIKS